MKTHFLILITAVILLAGCTRATLSSNPAWVDKLIKQFESEPVCNPPLSIWSYQYNDQVVYFVPAHCCDIFSILYDASGNVLCSPDGGISGAGDGRCSDFFSQRTDEQLIWSDSRLLGIKPETYPSPLSSVTPAPSPLQQINLPIVSSTPVVLTSPNIIEVSWDDYYATSDPGWLSNTIAQLAGSADENGKYSITVDITRGRFAKVIKAYTNSEWRIFSPERTFTIECGDDLKMYRVSDTQLISESSLLPHISPGVECSSFVEWAPDETIASFVADDNAVYIWRCNGDMPQKIITHIDFPGTAWSPNSRMLALTKYLPNLQTGTVNIFDSAGNLLHEFQFHPGGDGAILGWLTKEVLASYSRYTSWFYDIQSGQFLFSWTSMPTGDGIFHQYPRVSPNNRWVFIDQGRQEHESVSEPNHILVQKEYSLYDLLEKKQISLLNYLGNYLAYAGWNSDSSKMYVVSRPAESVSISNPSTPYGLLAYNVQTQQYDLLFKDAIQVAWNADKSLAFVVFPKQDDQGKLVLEGGVWKVGMDTLLGQQQVYEQVIYQDPAMDAVFPAFAGPISIAWSHNGRMVAIRDGFGRIKLIEENGAKKVLLDEKIGRQVALRWSPDDQHLLVLVDSRAWIVDIIIP